MNNQNAECSHFFLPLGIYNTNTTEWQHSERYVVWRVTILHYIEATLWPCALYSEPVEHRALSHAQQHTVRPWRRQCAQAYCRWAAGRLHGAHARAPAGSSRSLSDVVVRQQLAASSPHTHTRYVQSYLL